jgi:anti-anti-sigma factor
VELILRESNVEEIHINLRLEDKLAIIDIQGDVTSVAEKKLISTFEKAAAQQVKCIILNFMSVGYVNSAGMSIIISLLTRSKSLGQKLRAFGLSEHFQKIFDMVGILKYMPHFGSEQEARSHCT